MLSAPQAITGDVDVREVSNKDAYVIATARDYRWFSVLSVYASIRCDDRDSWMRPVVAEAEGRCLQWVSARRVEDDSMVGGAAFFREYIAFHHCPGSRVSHSCIREVKSSDRLQISQSA
jgi:hypothetical protein